MLKAATRECKLTTYKSLIGPVVAYASVVWPPHCACDLAQLEHVHKKAVRYHRYDQHFSPLSHAICLSLKLLEHKRMWTYRHFTQNSELWGQALAGQTPWTARPLHHFYRLFFKFSFFPFTVGLWNNLDVSLKNFLPIFFWMTYLTMCSVSLVCIHCYGPTSAMSQTVRWQYLCITKNK